MSGTHLFYNGILLRDCKLLGFSQVIEYDAESQTDPMYSRYRITVESRCISLHSVNPESPLPDDLTSSQNPLDRQHLSSIAIPEVDGETIVDRMRYIQEKLEKPRKDFWFALNAVSHKPVESNQPNQYTPSDTTDNNDSYRVLLAATGIDDYAAKNEDGGREITGRLGGSWLFTTNIRREDVVDMNNGPKPQSVDISEIHGGRYMRVVFSIEVCRPLCKYESEGPTVHPIRDADKVSGVISNRWGITETINENWDTTLNISGTLRVSDHRFKPDAMRLMTSCALIPYARVASRRFATSADGLTLKYEYTIKQEGIAPPPGLIDWSGRYIEKVQNGSHCTGTINVKVRGTHEIPTTLVDFDNQPIRSQERYKLYLTDWLFKIIQTRLNTSRAFNALPGQRQDNMVPIDVTVIENMKEPEVEANVTVIHSSQDFFEGFQLRLHSFGKTIYNANDPALQPLLANWFETDWPIPPAYTWEPRKNRKEQGSAYDCYFQSPCSAWHAKPEGWNRDFEVVDRNASAEEAGITTETYLYSGGEESVAEEIGLGNPPANTSFYGWSDQQTGGFTYLHVEIDNNYAQDEGRIAVPLSRQRNLNQGSQSTYPETVAVIPVHAGICTRKFTMVATRQGDWPKVPEPKQVIDNSSLGLRETLLKKDVLPEAPKLMKDGRTWEYSAQVQWTYVLSRPLNNAGDFYRASSDPRDKSTPDSNQLSVSDFFDTTGSISST